MYNKLYTYVHEIFLSTTIITFNYNYLWNFFTVMRERRREEGRGLRAKEWFWELEVFDGDSRDLACSEHEENTERERRCKGNENSLNKKGGEGDREKENRCYEIKTLVTKFMRGNSRKYCTISPAGKRSFGKILTIVKTKFLNNIYRNARNFHFFPL